MKRFALVCLYVLSFGILLFAQDGGMVGGTSERLHELENHAEVVNRLMWFHDYGEYDREIRQVANAARDYLAGVAKNSEKGDKLAAIFDIDETALSNWEAMAACGFCSYSAQVELCSTARDQVYCNDHDSAIVPIRELFDFAKESGITVFFVTVRPETQRDLTEKNLLLVGYSGWKELLMCDPKMDMECGQKPPPPASLIKPRSRKRILDQGYRIVLNIGDQSSDLAGCCAERVFKLPNPFYLLK
jgi:predicted secreted acid phosphatase